MPDETKTVDEAEPKESAAVAAADAEETPESAEATAASDEGDGSAADADSEASDQAATDGPSAEDVSVPEFAALKEGGGRKTNGSMDSFLDVRVPVWAELGRVELPLGDLVDLAEGAVLRLDRPVSDPVDVVSQGVRLARGEVIVIDDCFAIRIKEIIAKK